MDFRIFFGLLASVLTIISFWPYLRDIFKRKTKPHIYSWLVWSIIQSVGVLAMIRGGAGWGSLGLAIGALFCVGIFLLSFKYGTKNITKFDTFLLITALFTIIIWLIQENPLISVILVTIIDFIAFIPTYRKAYWAPHSEILSAYILDVAANSMAIIAITTYSLITTLYIGSLVLTNALMMLILIFRRTKNYR